ncbi:MAG: YbjN domain-containing protein, partial [Cyanobacteria bacterium P01_D01_bin.116]
MTTQTKQTQLNSELTLWESPESPIKIHALTIALTKEVHKVKDCRLTFQVTPEQYQLIDKQALFNLRPEVRTPLSGKPFQASSNIQIEASLEPDLLPQLTKHAKTSKKATTYLQTLSQEEPLHSLLSTYSWYALEVKQQQKAGETGFRTMWNYLKPSDIKDGGIDDKKLNEAMFGFTKDFVNSNSSTTSEDFISEEVKQLNNSFEQLNTYFSQITDKLVAEAVKEIDTAFAEVADNISSEIEEIAKEESIYQTTINFFNRENWQFQESSDKQGLTLGFKGKNGEWICYAIVREEQRQFLFYSVCMVKPPKTKLANIAEFITRANFGMAIGNFELDLTDGEIRYKTSIDVDGDRLNFDLISNLVYTNVMMMDKYLPGIIWVIRGDMEAE